MCDRPYRGEEANRIDGVDGHAIASAFTSYRVLEGASDPRFQGSGAPLGIWAGLELRGF